MRHITLPSGLSICGISEETYLYLRLRMVMDQHVAPEHLEEIRHFLKGLAECECDPRQCYDAVCDEWRSWRWSAAPPYEEVGPNDEMLRRLAGFTARLNVALQNEPDPCLIRRDLAEAQAAGFNPKRFWEHALEVNSDSCWPFPKWEDVDPNGSVPRQPSVEGLASPNP
jgi:hypothetical protein